jgi:hypothetical protein
VGIVIDGFKIGISAKFIPEALGSVFCEVIVGDCVGDDDYGEEKYCNFYLFEFGNRIYIFLR